MLRIRYYTSLLLLSFCVTVFAGESAQIAQSSTLAPVIAQGRSKVLYYSGSSVQVYVPPSVVMGGFRFLGSYQKALAPLVPTAASGSVVVAYPKNLGVESAVQPNNWYAVFACSNAGDTTATFRLMPFLRVGSVNGSAAKLNYAGTGPGAHAIEPATYNFKSNNLAGVDVLAITELKNGNNRFSGRITSITTNTATTVTLNNIGALGAFDFILPAPPGFTNYVYLGSFYVDASSNVTNIADTGLQVRSTNTYSQDPNFTASGAIAAPGVQIHLGGYISPLATGVIIQDNESIATSATGLLVTNFAHDGSTHLIAQSELQKETSISPFYSGTYFDIPFSIGQFFYYWTGGSLQSSRFSAQLKIQGWIEP